MAVDVCSASEPFTSPRISFSHDLNSQSSSTITAATANVTTTTFDFCIASNLVQQIMTSADELFFDGVLLPTQIKKPQIYHPEAEATVAEKQVINVQKKRLKELLSDNDEEQEQEKPSVMSFWKFARSMSLNSNMSRGPKRLFLRSLSLKRLLRSNSADSALHTKGNEATTKVIEKPNSDKEPAGLERCSTSIQSPSIHYNCNGKNYCRQSVTKQNSGGRVKINPILNMPPAYNMNLFGSGSLFCNGKSKNKTK